MLLDRFNKIFNIETTSISDEQAFVQRVNESIFLTIQSLLNNDEQQVLFRFLCYELGINSTDRITRFNSNGIGNRLRIPGLRTLTSDNLIETFKIIILLFDFFKKKPHTFITADKISTAVNEALNYCTHLSIRWEDGMFYPEGAKELDRTLVEEPYEWLEKYPDQRKDLINALKNYQTKKYNDVIDSCYLVVEGLTRKVLNNKKTLDNNTEELIKVLNLSHQWKSILKKYTDFANEYKRHASENRSKINPYEVEAYLYLTGLLVRLIRMIINRE